MNYADYSKLTWNCGNVIFYHERQQAVGNILMSLWNADDISTRLLMVEFYKNYLSGKTIRHSLKDAQKYIKNYVDESGNRMFESPYYWAGFIILD